MVPGNRDRGCGEALAHNERDKSFSRLPKNRKFGLGNSRERLVLGPSRPLSKWYRPTTSNPRVGRERGGEVDFPTLPTAVSGYWDWLATQG